MTADAPSPYRIPLDQLEASAHVPDDALVESVPVDPPVEDRPGLRKPDRGWFDTPGS